MARLILLTLILAVTGCGLKPDHPAFVVENIGPPPASGHTGGADGM